MRITGVLLAAGRAQRFGGDKLLARFADGPNAGTAVGVVAYRNFRAALDDVIVAVRPADETLRRAFEAVDARVVVAQRADEGLGASIAATVQASKAAEAYVFALADMPFIQPSTIARVAHMLAEGASIVAPRHAGRRGHPVGFSSAHRDALAALTGDEGARSIVESRRHLLTLVDVDDAGIVRDIDVPEPGLVAFRAS
jgi:molybdenum cofactor cytidylyltransferase